MYLKIMFILGSDSYKMFSNDIDYMEQQNYKHFSEIVVNGFVIFINAKNSSLLK